jgi:hypothetical protein
VNRDRALALVAAAVAIGAVLRAIPCWNDFWLDEIWTWLLAQRLDSWSDVFTGIHHSNNHHLNTLFYYWIGDAPHWAVYRLPALLTGTASIALAAGLGWRRGRLEAVLAAILTAGCFALIHFSSEARGSGPTVGFALAALWLLELDLERPRLWTVLLFGACVVLGFLSQLVFLFFWAGAFAQSAGRLIRRSGVGPQLAAGLLRLHAAPLLAFVALYAVDLRQLQVGGGPSLDLAWFVSRTVGYALGLPDRPEFAALYAGLIGLLLFFGLRLLAREHDELWLCVLVATIVAPVSVLAVMRPTVVDVRYFLIGIALCLLLLAFLLARALRRGGLQRAAALLLLFVFLAGNGDYTAGFLMFGRGGFRAALATMVELTPGPRIVVGSDHDFRNGRVLHFYARRLPADKTLDYRPREAWPATGPDWLVMHRRQRGKAQLPAVQMAGGRRFELVAEFPHEAISGFHWSLYRIAAASAGGPDQR